MSGRFERVARRLPVLYLLLGLASVCAALVFIAVSPYFLSTGNLLNVLEDVALAGIVAIPATFLVMSGNVDLSVGAAAAFTGIMLAAMVPDVGLVAAVVLAVCTGVLIGFVNGLLVTTAGLHSIAATFATMALLRSMAYLVPSGLALAVPGFRLLGNSRPVLGLALPTVLFGVLAVVGIVSSGTNVGRRARAIGASTSTDDPGLRADRHWVIGLFVISGAAATLVGLVRTSQLGTGLPTAALGTEITVLTAVLLGGGRLTGGRGSVIGTILALLVMSVIDNGLSLTNVTAYAGQVFHAALLLLALVIQRPSGGRRSRRTTTAAVATAEAVEDR